MCLCHVGAPVRLYQTKSWKIGCKNRHGWTAFLDPEIELCLFNTENVICHKITDWWQKRIKCVCIAISVGGSWLHHWHLMCTGTKLGNFCLLLRLNWNYAFSLKSYNTFCSVIHMLGTIQGNDAPLLLASASSLEELTALLKSAAVHHLPNRNAPVRYMWQICSSHLNHAGCSSTKWCHYLAANWIMLGCTHLKCLRI